MKPLTNPAAAKVKPPLPADATPLSLDRVVNDQESRANEQSANNQSNMIDNSADLVSENTIISNNQIRSQMDVVMLQQQLAGTNKNNAGPA